MMGLIKFKNYRNLKLTSGSYYLPKDIESKPLGEDAHFICEDKYTIGVADGVGGFASEGIDSGIYARELMFNSVAAIRNRFPGSVAVNPEEVLMEAYLNTKAEGASTACILTLKNKLLYCVNVGDSGFVVIRKGKAIYKSRVQQRGYNFPYQLGNGEKSDRPCSGQVMKIDVRMGDVIVAGSDGLFDNMFTSEIEFTVKQYLITSDHGGADGGGLSVEPKEMATVLAKLALYNSYDVYNETPFQVASKKYGRRHRGGKIDDITVIVSYVILHYE